MEHHKAIIWLAIALGAGAYWWYGRSHEIHAAQLTALGAGDPQGGSWLGVSPRAPSNAVNGTPQQILTTELIKLPGANQPMEYGMPSAPALIPGGTPLPQQPGVPSYAPLPSFGAQAGPAVPY